MAIRALHVAATGMEAQQLNVDTISNNIANSNTTGYKRSRPSFEDLAYQTISQVGANSSDAGTVLPTGSQVGLGVATGSVYKIHEQGALTATPGNKLNVAISGEGFLQVTLPNGDIGYTRDGTMQLSADGDFVTSQGFIISPGLTMPAGATFSTLTISSTGEVSVLVPPSITPTVLGTLELARFINPSGLNAIGNNLFLESVSSGAPITGNPGSPAFGTISHEFLENSNVNSVTEVSELIKAQRTFELNSRVLQTAESVLKTVIDSKA